MTGKKLVGLLRSICLVLAVAVIVSLVLAACAKPATQEETTPLALKYALPEYMELEHIDIAATDIIDVGLVEASGNMPEYVRVKGYVYPSIHFKVGLPTSDWNGKFYVGGGGGFCGSVGDLPANGLEKNYAVAIGDSGHWGSSSHDATWAYNNRQKEIDWGYRSIHEITRVGKALIEAYYGEPPAKSYFVGCSTGGKQALNEAQRYPEDFDGIICGAPALDYTGLAAIENAWNWQANHDKEGSRIIGPDEAEIIAGAVYDKCDDQDGLKDGIITDPRMCDFDPESLLDEGLTRKQVEALEKLYSGPKTSSGEQLYPGGLPIGSEPFWFLWVTGDGTPAFNFLFGQDFVKYMAFEEDPGPEYELSDFNFNKDPPKLEYMAKIYNAEDPDLSTFKDNGGKLIMYQGWADSCVPPFRTVEYYESVVKEMGGSDETQEFCRLFMVPGMDHCGILPGMGPDKFDMLLALEAWVETGVAPEKIIASQMKDGTLRTRPLYPYPLVAKWDGIGDPNDADSFVPVMP